MWPESICLNHHDRFTLIRVSRTHLLADFTITRTLQELLGPNTFTQRSSTRTFSNVLGEESAIVHSCPEHRAPRVPTEPWNTT
jgi:hypothetical protein